jgi:hypothetical protein
MAGAHTVKAQIGVVYRGLNEMIEAKAKEVVAAPVVELTQIIDQDALKETENSF